MTRDAAFWINLVHQIGCVVCRRFPDLDTHQPTQAHHVAVGSGPRFDCGVAALCETHHDPHRTGSGFHGMGTERFCKVYRVPFENEYGLLVWTIEDVARHLRLSAMLPI